MKIGAKFMLFWRYLCFYISSYNLYLFELRMLINNFSRILCYAVFRLDSCNCTCKFTSIIITVSKLFKKSYQKSRQSKYELNV